jgi:hypothetical protein
MEWWRMMQPSWRRKGSPLIRNTPKGETWQTLRKGGMAGIYVVVMGLSWWIKAQCAEHDFNAWTIVDDLSWVIQELKKGMAASMAVSLKRAREGDSEGELAVQPLRKRYVDRY